MVTINEATLATVAPLAYWITAFGKSTDAKPQEYKGGEIFNGSTYTELDTAKLFVYDGESKAWLDWSGG